MKVIVRFYENARKLITDSSRSDRKVSWGQIMSTAQDQFTKMTKMNRLLPTMPKDEMNKKFDDCLEAIDAVFQQMALGEY